MTPPVLVFRLIDMESPPNEEVLEDLYSWIDTIKLSRPKKHFCRDFSDGVLVAEVVSHWFPRLVELHNFVPCSNVQHKKSNWALLNRKVFSKLSLEIADDVVDKIIKAEPYVIEQVLMKVRSKIYQAKTHQEDRDPDRVNELMNDQPEVDQQQHKGQGHHKGQGQQRGIGKVKGKQSKTVDRTKQNPKPTEPHDGNKPEKIHPHVPASLLPDETVPRILLEEKKQECLAKEETIQILLAKVRRLEQLLHLKDIRIDDLQNRMDRARPTGKPKVMTKK